MIKQHVFLLFVYLFKVSLQRRITLKFTFENIFIRKLKDSLTIFLSLNKLSHIDKAF
jgi:hypothetical protein